MRSDSEKNKSNEYVQLSLTLFAISAIVALMLSMLNFFMAPKIAEVNQQKAEAVVKSVLPEGMKFEDVSENILGKLDSDSTVLNAWIGKDESETLVGYCFKIAAKGYSDPIELMVGIDADGAIIETKIVSLSDTSGRGTQIRDKSFLSQFPGKSGVLVSKKGTASSLNEVSLIAGATYTSKGFIDGVNAALQAYQIIVEEGDK